MSLVLYLYAGLRSSWNVICLWIWKETRRQKMNLVTAVLRSLVFVLMAILTVSVTSHLCRIALLSIVTGIFFCINSSTMAVFELWKNYWRFGGWFYLFCSAVSKILYNFWGSGINLSIERCSMAIIICFAMVVFGY